MNELIRNIDIVGLNIINFCNFNNIEFWSERFRNGTFGFRFHFKKNGRGLYIMIDENQFKNPKNTIDFVKDRLIDEFFLDEE